MPFSRRNDGTVIIDLHLKREKISRLRGVTKKSNTVMDALRDQWMEEL
jgi:hypothetical protein